MDVCTSYLVCATPRSGSSFLCETLARTDMAGYPQEFFWEGFEPSWARRWDVSDPEAYLRSAMREGTSPNEVFGAKIMWSHLAYFVRRFLTDGEQSIPEALSRKFPNLHYVWISRRDTVAQAVSYSRALQTQVWNETGGRPVLAADPVFDFDAITRLIQEADAHNTAWQEFFIQHDIKPFHVVYEDFVAHPQAYARDILRFLGVPFREPLMLRSARLRKQADGLSQEWIERYREMAAQRSLTTPVR